MKKQIFIAETPNDEEPPNPRVDWDNLGHMICSHRNYLLGDEQSDAPSSLGGYADDEDNFLIWVFTEFIEGSKTVPDILKDWTTDGYELEFCKELDSGSLVYLPEGIPESFQAAIEGWMKKNLCILPLYLYDHSGITMNTSGFSCGWDSGTVGYIYLTKEKWDKEHDRDFVQEEAAKYLVGEVETYDQYLTGSVYGKILHRVDDEDFEISRNISLLEANPLYDLYIGDYEFSINEYGDTEELDASWGYYGHDYVVQCCKEEFPEYCLSEALGDYCERYLIKQEVEVNNGIGKAIVTKVTNLPRKLALEAIQLIPSVFLDRFTVEPFAHTKAAPNKAWGYM